MRPRSMRRSGFCWRVFLPSRRTGARGLALVAIALASCSGIEIRSEYDPDVSFAGLHSYDWMTMSRQPASKPALDDPQLDAFVRATIERQLGERGYEKQAGGTADFHIGYRLALEKKLAVSTLNDWYGYRAGWGWRYGAMGQAAFPESYSYEYDEGSLVIDIARPGAQQPLWRGSAAAEVKRGRTPERRKARIEEAVRRILSRFPPNG